MEPYLAFQSKNTLWVPFLTKATRLPSSQRGCGPADNLASQKSVQHWYADQVMFGKVLEAVGNYAHTSMTRDMLTPERPVAPPGERMKAPDGDLQCIWLCVNDSCVCMRCCQKPGMLEDTGIQDITPTTHHNLRFRCFRVPRAARDGCCVAPA